MGIYVTTSENGAPVSFTPDGQPWVVAADAVRWFERVAWWETKSRMSMRDEGSSIDVEVWRLQAHTVSGPEADELTTFELIRDAADWTLRSQRR
jgi:hypothetical protein